MIGENPRTGRRLGDKMCPMGETEGAQYAGNVFRCLVYLIPEDDGGYSVIAANLPGAASQGDTEQEALFNITDALKGLLASYRDSSTKTPWTEEPRPKDDPRTKERWVIVHA